MLPTSPAPDTPHRLRTSVAELHATMRRPGKYSATICAQLGLGEPDSAPHTGWVPLEQAIEERVRKGDWVFTLSTRHWPAPRKNSLGRAVRQLLTMPGLPARCEYRSCGDRIEVAVPIEAWGDQPGSPLGEALARTGIVIDLILTHTHQGLLCVDRLDIDARPLAHPNSP